jgi:hypothetical protein
MSLVSEGPGWWQAPNAVWHPPDSPPFFLNPNLGFPEGCPGPDHWQSPDGCWFPMTTPPFDPSGLSQSLEIASQLSQAGDPSPEASGVSDADQSIKQAIEVLQVSLGERQRNLKEVSKRLATTTSEMTDRVQKASKTVESAKQAARLSNRSSSIKVYEDSIVANKNWHLLTSDVEVTLDTAGNISHTRRHTITRFAALGPLSVFTPKNIKSDDRELFILLEGPTWAEVVKVDKDKQKAARELVQTIKLAVRSVDNAKRVRSDRVRTAKNNLQALATDWSAVEKAERRYLSVSSETLPIAHASEALRTLLHHGPSAKDRTVKRANEVLLQADIALDRSLELPARPTLDLKSLSEYPAEDAGQFPSLELENPLESSAELVPPPREAGPNEQIDDSTELIANKIRQLVKLNESGAITNEQFELKRQELIDRL